VTHGENVLSEIKTDELSDPFGSETDLGSEPGPRTLALHPISAASRSTRTRPRLATVCPHPRATSGSTARPDSSRPASAAAAIAKRSSHDSATRNTWLARPSDTAVASCRTRSWGIFGTQRVGSGHIPGGHQEMVAAAFRTIFAQIPRGDRRPMGPRPSHARLPFRQGGRTHRTAQRPRCSPFAPSPEPTGARSGGRTRSSCSTKNSSAEWWGSSPTMPLPSAWPARWSPTSTTSGRPRNAATSQRPLWRISIPSAMTTTWHPRSSRSVSDRHRG
jgi:hypothetical protein